MSSTSADPPLAVENLETARFRCVFPECGGICCRNGRPAVTPAEAARIDAALPRLLPLLRDGARAAIEKDGWLTRRKKEGHRTAAVHDGWCVFENGGCALQRLGMAEGEPWKLKPLACVKFPLEQTGQGTWYVRQQGHRGEAWDLFCLDPEEAPDALPRETLAGEMEYVARRSR